MPIYGFVIGQGRILLILFSLGLGLGFFYDCIRVIRRLFLVGRLLVDITDILYWFVATAFVWHVQNEIAEGVVRLSHFLAIALGMILYYSMISSVVIWAIYTPLHFMGKCFVVIYRYIGRSVDHVVEGIDSLIQKIKKRDIYEEAAKKTKKTGSG